VGNPKRQKSKRQKKSQAPNVNHGKCDIWRP